MRNFEIVLAKRESKEALREIWTRGRLDKNVKDAIAAPLNRPAHNAEQFLATVNPDVNWDFRLDDDELAASMVTYCATLGRRRTNGRSKRDSGPHTSHASICFTSSRGLRQDYGNDYAALPLNARS